ncbi:glycosyltransferase [Streptacidiphilus cavernicola]|uniref:Glycosyltransferase n=1 Tax=Streptacidiphilus cavernicola TaxID=3342716 RepID=A0ABV6W2Y1_9ACTN
MSDSAAHPAGAVRAARAVRADRAFEPLAFAARAALPLALLLWLLSLRSVDLDRMGDLGLLQVLPALYWVAVGVLTAGFTLAVADRRTGTGWLVGYLLGLIAMIHSTPAVLYSELRYSWAWKHIAVIDAVLNHGGSVPHAADLAIYNQWPGFFQLNALLLRATGLHSALGYAAWTPPVVNALLLAPLLLVYRSVSRDRRLVWGGVWIFYSCSWVGQDYFSPQAFAFLLYVVVLALVFRQLSAGSGRPAAGRVWTPGRLLPVLVLQAAIVSSHQLTPLMMVTALAALSLPRANRRVTVPPLLGAVLLMLLWDATVARPYITANLHSFGTALLSPDGNAVAGIAGLGAAAPGQVVVDWIDRGLTATVVLLALLCFVRRPWVRRSGIPLIAASPLPLLVANSYGGEMIFRVYLFALPGSAFLIAALILQPGPRARLREAGAFVLALALLGGLFFGYYGKELMNRFTPGEVSAAGYVTATAPAGSTVVALTGNVPGFYQDYDRHVLIQLSQESDDVTTLLVRDPLAGLELAVGDQVRTGYLLLSRGQAAECYLTGVLPADTMARLQAAVAGAPGFTEVYRDPDAVVYRFGPTGVGG